jgi:uncharacterized protein YlxP (DUF503 family)
VFVLALEVDLRIPDSHSLKDKRQVVSSLLETSRRRFSVSAAEIGHQDSWQRAVLGFAVVASTARHAEDVMDTVEDHLWSRHGVEVVSAERSWLED